jgi:ribosomal protein S18 acetylase RimI-like enzyme
MVVLTRTTTTLPTIKTAGAAEEARTIDTILLAFSRDPAVRWMYPDPHQYVRNFPEFIRAFAGKAFEHGTAHYVDGFLGAALWLPPGVKTDDDTLDEVLERTVPDAARDEVFAVFEQMDSYHPRRAHWYLPLIGVDPTRQGEGYGSALLRHALVRCDRDGLPAYLESSNPANIPLYERHGFELLGEVQAGDSPPLYPMLRQPR